MPDFKKLDQLKQKLDSYRPLPQEMVDNLHEDQVLRWTYNSNAIEGNTLTLKETKVALEGIMVGGKTMREHFEAINHRDAILFIEELVTDKESLSEWVINNIHQLILKNIDDKNAGVYRKINVTIAGSGHVPPDALQVPDLMQRFLEWYDTEAQKLHPVERTARMHSELVKIHPYVDGNGRTSRLIMNLELIKDGFPPVVIPVSRRLEYYEALDIDHTTGNHSLFLNLVGNMLVEAFEPYWFALGLDR
jgi:Fic family protein